MDARQLKFNISSDKSKETEVVLNRPARYLNTIKKLSVASLKIIIWSLIKIKRRTDLLDLVSKLSNQKKFRCMNKRKISEQSRKKG